MAPNIFISWSGSRARELAQAMHRFLPDVIQNARPWLSSEDIHKGRRWSSEIANALQSARIGVVCLTPENLHADWMLFEAGALAKTLDTAFVCPYLLGMEPTEVGSPLADFQLTTADKTSTAKLITSINAALGGVVHDDRVSRTFERFWPDLQTVIDALLGAPLPDDDPDAQGSVLREIMSRVKLIEEYLVGEVSGEGSIAAMLMLRNEVRYICTRHQIAANEAVRLDALIPTDGPSLAYRDEERQHYLKVRDLAAKQMEELLAGIQRLRTETESTAT